MRNLLLLVGLTAGLAAAQTSHNTIEGYWQDTERRILYSPDAPASYVFGRWTALDQNQTYPAAKEIRRSGGGYELLDLLYDDEEQIKVVRAGDSGIEEQRGFGGNDNLTHAQLGENRIAVHDVTRDRTRFEIHHQLRIHRTRSPPLRILSRSAPVLR